MLRLNASSKVLSIVTPAPPKRTIPQQISQVFFELLLSQCTDALASSELRVSGGDGAELNST
jgi:hypothetical protein